SSSPSIQATFGPGSGSGSINVSVYVDQTGAQDTFGRCGVTTVFVNSPSQNQISELKYKPTRPASTVAGLGRSARSQRLLRTRSGTSLVSASLAARMSWAPFRETVTLFQQMEATAQRLTQCGRLRSSALIVSQ